MLKHKLEAISVISFIFLITGFIVMLSNINSNPIQKYIGAGLASIGLLSILIIVMYIYCRIDRSTIHIYQEETHLDNQEDK